MLNSDKILFNNDLMDALTVLKISIRTTEMSFLSLIDNSVS